MRHALRMGRYVCAAMVAAVMVSAACAQPPERPEGSPGPGRDEGQRRGPPEGGGPSGGQRRGPPSPERFVEHAMSFDADGDGKLDRAELTKFAEEFARMRGGPGGQGGGPAGGRGQGRGGPGGPPGAGDGGDRPVRPQRPE